MATQTFLQIVNAVMVELRDTEVVTHDSTDYSVLISRFVNSAKRAVENAWTWHALRESFNITAAVDTVTYALTGTDERAQIIDVWNYTQGWEMYQRTMRSMNQVYFAAGGAGVFTGSPTHYIPNGVDASGQTQVDVYPVPDTTDTIIVNAYAPVSDWTSDDDICYIPYEPIIKTALALAKGERGEDGGITETQAGAFAAAAAGDAIAIDASKHPDTTTWEAV